MQHGNQGSSGIGKHKPAKVENLNQYADQFKMLFRCLRQFMVKLLILLCIAMTPLMLWRGLRFFTGCESPIIVVLSGSMEPAFKRGDILLLNMWGQEDLGSGDIIVFRIEGREIPIVHRILNS